MTIRNTAALLAFLRERPNAIVYAGKFPLPYVYSKGYLDFANKISDGLAAQLDQVPELVAEVQAGATVYRLKTERNDDHAPTDRE